MGAWADFLISEVKYGPGHTISQVKQHWEENNKITSGEIVDKATITSNMRKKKSYMTIYNKGESWGRGNKLRIFEVGVDDYVRIDKNKVSSDNLGDILEF